MGTFILISFEGYYFMSMNDGFLELVDHPNMAKEFATELDAIRYMMQLGINEVHFSIVSRKEHMELYEKKEYTPKRRYEDGDRSSDVIEKIRPSWIER